MKSFILFVPRFIISEIKLSSNKDLLTSTMANDDLGGLSTTKLHEMDDFLNKTYIEPKKLAGLLTTVYRKGELVHCNPIGLKDRDSNAEVDKDTIFRIYSMTKPITSIALMMLYEKGLFQLDDPVHKYIPEFKSLAVYVSGKDPDFITKPVDRPVNIHDLLTHQSGFTYDFMQTTEVDFAYEKRNIMRNKDKSLEYFIKELSVLPLQFSPGTRWNYSVSVDICGYLIQLLSGYSLDDFFKKYIFDPLGMKDTDFYVPSEKINRVASNYLYTGPGIPRLITSKEEGDITQKPKLLSGGGGLMSTSGDYLQFCKMILGNGKFEGRQFVSRKTIELMSSNHLTGGADLSHMAFSRWSESKFDGTGFGLGFSVITDPVRARTLSSKGEIAWGGLASTAFWIDPLEDLIVIFMTQLIPSTTYDIRRQLRSYVYGSILD